MPALRSSDCCQVSGILLRYDQEEIGGRQKNFSTHLYNSDRVKRQTHPRRRLSRNAPSKLARTFSPNGLSAAPLSGRRAVGGFPIAPVERAPLHRARSGSRESFQRSYAFSPGSWIGPATPLWPASLLETHRPAIETGRPYRLAR